jgi:hypothetical protein
VLRPCGGLLLIGGSGDDRGRAAVESWARAAGGAVTVGHDDAGTWCRGVRGRLPGSGDWTHQYGTAANQGYCGETLRGATAIDDLELQWIGNPGPRYQPDRQVRKPAPLAANGRLYMQGLDRIIAADAYNGTILWSLEVPGLRRFNLPRDASNMCADDDHLYVAAGDACWKISGADGRLVASFPVVRPRSAARTSPASGAAATGSTARGAGTPPRRAATTCSPSTRRRARCSGRTPAGW